MIWREYIIIRIVALALAGWCVLLSLACLEAYDEVFLGYPKGPDPDSNRIFAYSFKSTVRYLTKEQITRIHWLNWTLIILAIFITLNLLINLKWPLPSKNDEFIDQ
jgi:hypothetical protein